VSRCLFPRQVEIANDALQNIGAKHRPSVPWWALMMLVWALSSPIQQL